MTKNILELPGYLMELPKPAIQQLEINAQIISDICAIAQEIAGETTGELSLGKLWDLQTILLTWEGKVRDRITYLKKHRTI